MLEKIGNGPTLYMGLTARAPHTSGKDTAVMTFFNVLLTSGKFLDIFAIEKAAWKRAPPN